MTAQEAEPRTTRTRRLPTWSLWIGVGALSAALTGWLFSDFLARFPQGFMSYSMLQSILSGSLLTCALLLLPMAFARTMTTRWPRVSALIANAFALAVTFRLVFGALGAGLGRNGRHAFENEGDAGLIPTIIMTLVAGLILRFYYRLFATNRSGFLTIAVAHVVVLVAAIAVGRPIVERWSRELPPSIVAAAEDIAAGATYCMQVGRFPLHSVDQLQAKALARTADWGFYVTLLIQDEPAPRHFNWSFTQRGFVPIPAPKIAGVKSYLIESCPNPRPHFALGLK